MTTSLTRIYCEGCEATAESTFSTKGRYAPRNPRLQPGWSNCGRSRKLPGRMAMWCPDCERAARDRHYQNPTEAEVNHLLFRIRVRDLRKERDELEQQIRQARTPEASWVQQLDTLKRELIALQEAE